MTETDKQVLYANKDLTKKVNLMVSKDLLYNNNLFPKPEIDASIIHSFLESVSLDIDDNMLDIARTTHDYAAKFNEIIGDISCSICPYDVPYMLSSSDGYSFIGEAFVHFVSALVVHDMFPTETSANLTNYANIIKGNCHLSKTSHAIGLDKTLTKLRKVQRSYRQFCKEGAMAYKGLIGCLYRHHGPSKILDIMRFVNKTLVTDNIVDFSGKESSNRMREIAICVVSTVFGWMTCYITLISLPNTCFKAI